MCAALYTANEDVHGKAMPAFVKEAFLEDGLLEVVSPPGGPQYWYPVECYPVDFHRQAQLTAAQWQSLVVQSPEELRLAAEDKRLPKGLNTKAQQDLAFWIVSRIICDEKSLDARDDSVSMHLYQRLHYVYAFSVGEASVVELITSTSAFVSALLSVASSLVDLLQS